MNWIQLHAFEQLEKIRTESIAQPILIFKHSTRCNISAMAYERLNRFHDGDRISHAYFLDLLNHRDISNRIAEMFQVYHESPQVLIIKNGECIYDASHLEINGAEILEYFNESASV